jgi:signal transduction histidine kinase
MKVEALERLGRYKEALEWQHKLKNFKDSLTTADNMKELNMLNKHFEVNELKMEAERNRLRAKTQQLFLIIVIAVVALIALVVFIILRHRTTAKLAKAHNELQKAYEQLEIANSKAEESLRMKNNFIHQISHEINTPLSILSGFSQIITMPNIKLSTEEREKLYKDLVENTNRISGLVNRVIDLSEANSKVAIERCDKVEAILIAMDAIESSGISQATHLEFSQQIPDEIGNIVLTTNQKAATRALIQILDNAYKFTTPTGSKKAYQDQPEIAEKKRARLTVTRNDTHILFTVEDNGIVIPPEEAEHIFEEFVQLNIFYEGTGVGLTIARSLARKLGGDITLDTNYISGARFIMSLPLK